MMTKLYHLTSALLVVVLFMGCTKKEVAADTKLSYSFSATNLNASLSSNASASGAVVAAGTNGSINWATASINVAKIEFSATKSGSGAINLETKNLYLVNALKPDSLSGTVAIASGVYEKNQFSLTLTSSVTNPPLLLTGTYIEASGTKIPVRFEMNQSQLIKLEAQRVEVTAGTYLARVTVQLNALVTGLTASDFGQTTRTGTNNMIIISTTINKALYEKLTARFTSTLSVNFSKQ
ncbi:hypothetical protein G7074_20370 [Pedobacter sp. HDW13]|uniref:hypothetical protein n=1 Tax=unclassified Pedobacter TaxID=2628915 RepID=UPI000F5B3D41|nr:MULTISPECIES: hypothetical protein [unclassified Pedobacter]QIL41409.1 hypothetical protein G7074_20370 [Pedobacter sp. HDW13]